MDLADGTIGHNKIKIPVSGEETDTLLAWFAKNTGTANAADNCRDTTCPTGQSMTIQGFCATSNLIDDHNNYCPATDQIIRTTVHSPALCCTTNKKDDGENCCLSGNTTNTINASMNLSNGTYVATTEQNALLPETELCAPEGITAYNHVMTNGNDIILCSGDVEWGDTDGINSIGFNQDTAEYPNGTEIKCKGTLYKIRINGTTKIYSNSYYIEIIGDQEQKCTFNFATSTWTTSNGTECQGTLNQGTFIK